MGQALGQMNGEEGQEGAQPPMMGIMCAVQKMGAPAYVDYRAAVNYLAGLVYCKKCFILERDGDQYVHSAESDTWDEVLETFPGARDKTVTRRICHILDRTAKKYCVFFDNADETGTVCVVDLSDPSRVVDFSGDAARHMPMYPMLERAQALLDLEAKMERQAHDEAQ